MGRRQPESAGRFSKAAVLAAAVGMFALAGAGEALAEAPASHETHTDTVAVQQHEQHKAPAPVVHKAPETQAPKPVEKPAPPTPPAEKTVSYDYTEQKEYYYCAPAATREALTVHGKAPTQDQVAGELGTTVNGTDSAKQTTQVLNNNLGSNTYTTREVPAKDSNSWGQVEQTRKDLQHTTGLHDSAVVANVQGTISDTAGRPHSYEGGHYLAVVGYGEDGWTAKIADPYDPQDGPYVVTTEDLTKWVGGHGESVIADNHHDSQ